MPLYAPHVWRPRVGGQGLQLAYLPAGSICCKLQSLGTAGLHRSSSFPPPPVALLSISCAHKAPHCRYNSIVGTLRALGSVARLCRLALLLEVLQGRVSARWFRLVFFRMFQLRMPNILGGDRDCLGGLHLVGWCSWAWGLRCDPFARAPRWRRGRGNVSG